MSRPRASGMAGIARAALEEYRVGCAELRLVSLGTNTCYRVRSPGDGLLFLRVVSPEYFVAVALSPEGNLGKARFLLRLAAPRLAKELS